MQADQSQAILRQAEDSFRQADYDQTLTALVRGFATDTEYRPFYTLAAQTLELMKAQEEAMLFWHALEHFEDWEPFFKIGYHFVDVWQYEMAKPFLEKSHRLDPSNPDGVHELALCYANTFELPKAIELLEGFENHDFWTVYRLHRYWLLTDRVGPLQDYLDESFQKLSHLEQDDEAIPQAYNLLNELKRMWTRYQLLPENEIHLLTKWHFVQYGTAILDMAADNGQEGTGGRYLQYEGTKESIAAILHQVISYLQMIEYNIKKVVYLENTYDAILGNALALLLDIPAEEADGDNLLHDHTLVVAANNKTFNGEHDLWEVRRHQLVFAFSIDWLQPSMLCPDLIGVLSKHCQFPWKEDLKRLSIAQIAQELADIAVKLTDYWLKFYQEVREALLGGAKAYQQRPTFRVESPIAGMYL